MAKKSLTNSLQPVLAAAGGVVLARLANKVSFISQNPMIGAGIKAGLGVFMASQSNKMISSAGLGMAAVGTSELLTSILPEGALGGVGFLPAAGSMSVHAVAGVPPIIID